MTMLNRLNSASLHSAVRAVMEEAAERAVMPHFRKLAQDQVREKAADELVTIADQQSEAILAAGLARILPEALIVGEEAADADPQVLTRLSGSLCWIIDPLDGTGNFTAGTGPFGILVALAERGEPIGGWIYDPRSGRFCAALRGEGAFINDQPVHARGSGNQTPIAAISSLVRDPDRRARMLARMDEAFELVPIPRCAAEQYPRIMLGQNDLTLFERTLAWDHASGIICLMEAGGLATRLDGSPYRVDQDERGLIAAATPKIWEQAVDLLRAFV